MDFTKMLVRELAKSHPSNHEQQKAYLTSIIKVCGMVQLHGSTYTLQIVTNRIEVVEKVRMLLRSLYGAEISTHTMADYKYCMDLHSGVEQILYNLHFFFSNNHAIVKGFPPYIIGGPKDIILSALKGAVLSSGILRPPVNIHSFELSATTMEAEIGIMGFARRLGVSSIIREYKDEEKIYVRDHQNIIKMLEILELPETQKSWSDLEVQLESLNRSESSAFLSSMIIRDAFEKIGDKIPPNIKAVALMRLNHQDSNLEEIGKMFTPPLTKDAVASRIKRLMTLYHKEVRD
jgi:DNA-binding protein WhiA